MSTRNSIDVHRMHILPALRNFFITSHYLPIKAYGSTPYVGMAPKKMAATLKVHK